MKKANANNCIKVLIISMAIITGLSISARAQLHGQCVFTTPQNPTQAENLWCGTTSWEIGQQGAFNRQIEGYASATSVNKGETITFHVNQTFPNTTDRSFRFDIYRMGWYQGNGGRLIYSRTNIPGKHQMLPQSNSVTGLMECDWTPKTGAEAQHQWTVPTDAVSGVYLVKLTTEVKPNYSSYIIFVVRDDARQSDIVFQTSETTWQAYNLYPGNRDSAAVLPTDDPDPNHVGSAYSGMSLYTQTFGRLLPPFNSDGTGGVRQARKVSFNRPYGIDNNRIDITAGQFFQWEYNMVRWLEREGMDVSYISNLDTHTADGENRFAPGKHKAFLSVGHDEYWSMEMRNSVEQARNRSTQPMNLGFFSANTMFWQIRLEDSSENSEPANERNRTIVGYKEYARNSDVDANDPYYNDNFQTPSVTSNDNLITNRWRDNQTENLGGGGTCPGGGTACYRPPEDEVIGVQYSYIFHHVHNEPLDTGGICPTNIGCNPEGDFKISKLACPTWVCAGMRADGGEYNLGYLLGYEADRVFRSYPNRSSFLTVSSSPVYNRINGVLTLVPNFTSNSAYYSLGNGAKVFATGTIQYAWGLDDYSPLQYIQPPSGPLEIRRIHDAMANGNAQALTANMLGCLVGGVCQ